MQKSADPDPETIGTPQKFWSRWDAADCMIIRRILEVLWLDFVLDDVNLVPEMRRPFDVLVEGPCSESRS